MHPVLRKTPSREAPVASLLCKWAVAITLCTGAAVSYGAASEGQLSVHITLSNSTADTAQLSAPGVCISQTLSLQTNALVRVVCGNGQFVSISTNPNARFLGTHGGAFRYAFSSSSSFGTNSGLQGQWENFYPGTGTVTAMHVHNVAGTDSPIEILLTF